MNRIPTDFSKRIGSMEAVFSRLAIVNAQCGTTTLLEPGETFQIFVEVSFKSTLTSPTVGLLIKDRLGRIISSTATNLFPETLLKGLTGEALEWS